VQLLLTVPAVPQSAPEILCHHHRNCHHCVLLVLHDDLAAAAAAAAAPAMVSERPAAAAAAGDREALVLQTSLVADLNSGRMLLLHLLLPCFLALPLHPLSPLLLSFLCWHCCCSEAWQQQHQRQQKQQQWGPSKKTAL
jgi:hypothetical protein